jgi:hypothetical protein
MKPQNFPESVIWYSLVATYGVYLIGGLYILGPAIALILLGYLGKKLWEQTDATPAAEKIIIPWTVWTWVAGMLVMLLALLIGHLDFGMSLVATIKSCVGWLKGWALMAIFPLIGCLKIRPQILYRGACIVCLCSLVLAPFLYIAYLLHLPTILYVSPLKIIGGAGDLFFQVRLYTIDSEGGVRWPFFAPWGPATGLMGNVYFFMALQEKNSRWRWSGILGSCALIYLSKSRMATLFVVVVLLLTWGLTKLAKPSFLILVGLGSTLTGIIAPTLIGWANVYWQNFRAARADSSQVRDALQRIALRRWWTEAPIWGHGVVERGPHLVQYMPIGSHHTIFSLLFLRGIVGLVAFIIPMACSLIDLIIKAQKNEVAQVGLSILLLFCCYSFGENLEVLAYLFWPGLVVIGIAFVEKISLNTTAKITE